MAVTNSNNAQLTFSNLPVGIQVTIVTDTSADWPSVANSTYFYDKGDGLVHYKNSSGVVLELFADTFTGYDYEIHVSQVDGNDTTGDGSLLNPVATITYALTLLTGSRKTIIVHPGGYSENVTVANTNTTIATTELTGANTLLYGTLTIGTLGSGSRISGLKMTNLVISGTAQAYISNCTVDNQVTKSSSGFVEIINSEMQCISGIQISGAGTIIINGNKNVAVSVSNASAQVILKGCNSVVTPSASAGNLAIVDCIVTALGGNGITITGASTTLTLLNSQVLVTAGNNVAPISVAGIYSIINTIYDKPSSTITGTSTNSIDYFQYINADKFIKQGGTSSEFLKADGSVDSTAYQAALTLTTTGTSGAATLVGSTLNVPQYAGGLTYFTEAESTSAPNATVNVDSLTPNAASTNADAAIVLKGTGALLTSIPDNTGTGGNKRGQSAVDLQAKRFGASEVASGNFSVIAGGCRNTASGAYSFVGGGCNSCATGSYSSVTSGFVNMATGNYSGIVSGSNNVTSSGYAFVGGGRLNTASNLWNTVAGGFQNTASGYRMAFIGGGRLNTASGGYTSISGGCGNTVSNTYGVVGGGRNNLNCGSYATIAGGRGNTASGYGTTVLGGVNNSAASQYGAVVGGYFVSAGYFSFAGAGLLNSSSGSYSAVVGGDNNLASGPTSFVGAGSHNTSSSFRTAIVGGLYHTANAPQSFIGGGYLNTASGSYSTVGGGQSNTASGVHSGIFGGVGNSATSGKSFIGGGSSNTASSLYATISGGFKNLSQGIAASIGGGNCNSVCNSTSGCLAIGATVAGGIGNNTFGGTWTLASCAFTVSPTLCNAGQYSFVGGGFQNLSLSTASVITGGICNTSSGAYSTVGGGFCNVSSTSNASVLGGLRNCATGVYSTVGGGRRNCATFLDSGTFSGSYNTSSSYSTIVAGGSLNVASGSYSGVLGGTSNAASGVRSSIGGGSLNTASGNYSAAFNYCNTASGLRSFAANVGNVASCDAATAFGQYTASTGERSFGHGTFGNTFGTMDRYIHSTYGWVSGDSQMSRVLLNKRTTDATPSTMNIGAGNYGLSAATQLTLQNNSSLRFKGTIIGKQSGSTNIASWDIDGLIVRGANAASTTLNIANVNLIQNTPAWGTPTLAADTTNGGLQVQVIGVGATNIQWTAVIETTEVIYA